MFSQDITREIQVNAMKMLRKHDFSYSELVRMIRDYSSLGRRDFSKAVGVDESTIKRLERNPDYNPTKGVLEKILEPAGLGLGLVTIGSIRSVPKSQVKSAAKEAVEASSVAKSKERFRFVGGKFVKV